MPTRALPKPWLSLSFAPIVAVAVAVGLLVVGLSMALYNENLSKTEKLREVTVQANILSGSVAAALAFDDARLAQEYVDALGANRDLEAAGVYDLSGKLVAGYAQAGQSAPATNLARTPFFDNGALVVSRPVVQGGTTLGSVYMRTVLEPFSRRAARYAGIGLLVVMAALVVAVLGVSNASLVEAQRRLRVEMDERERAEQALRLSQEMEAAAQLEIAAQRAREALRQSERQLEFALNAGRLGSWVVELKTGALTASEFFWANFGLDQTSRVERSRDLRPYIHPDDRRIQKEKINAAIQDGGDIELEYRTLSPDGEERWILVRGQAVYGEDGVAQRIAGVSLDVTARRTAEDRQRLLLDELNHRVKNTLATVQSIAIQTVRDTRDAAAFERAFLARLSALSTVHDLLSRVSWEGASLADVVRQTLAPYVDGGEGGKSLSVDGPNVRLGPNAAVTLTMAFHELATNAAKYGALSVDTGQVAVCWRTDDPRTPNVVEIVWRESGGPPVVKPVVRGFGSRFVERGLAHEFDAEVQLDFDPAGVTCRMQIPMSIKLGMAA